MPFITRRMIPKPCRLFLCLLLPSLASVVPADELTTLQGLVREWVALRGTQSAEAADWETERRRLMAELELLEMAEGRLRAERDTLQQQATRQDESRTEAQQELAGHTDALAGLSPDLARSENHAAAIMSRLPASLRETLQGDVDAVESAADPLLRTRAMLALQDKLLALQHDLTVSRVVLDLENGRQAFDTLFIGTAFAFAVSPDDRQALLGTPEEGGWIWQPIPEHAERIREALTLAEGETSPRLVDLPVPGTAP